MRADSLSLIEDLSQLYTSTSSRVFPQQYVCERDPVYSVSSGIYPERRWLKRGWTSLQWLIFRLVLHLTRWRDVWIPCGDPRESHSSPPHLDRGNQISLIPREAHRIQGFKGDDAWLFFKMERNPNITAPTRKWALVSCLTSRSVPIVLPSLV